MSEPQTAEIVRAEAALPVVRDTTPAGLLALAVQADLDLEKLKGLMDLQREWEKDNARKAFFEAMAAFQSEVPPLGKDSTVDFQTSKGRTHYRHASLGGIVTATRDALFRNGLSYRFEINPAESGLSVTCIITHKLGHSERTTMGAPPDNSGNKNEIQGLGSTVTYMQRYTLVAALGLVTSDEDTDGRPSMTGPAKPDPVVPDDWPPPAPKSAPAAPEGASEGERGDAYEEEAPEAPAGHPFAVGGEYEGEVTYIQPEAKWKAVGNAKGKWIKVEVNGVKVGCKTLSNPAGSKEAGPWGKGTRVTFTVEEAFEFDKPGDYGATIAHVRPV